MGDLDVARHRCGGARCVVIVLNQRSNRTEPTRPYPDRNQYSNTLGTRTHARLCGCIWPCRMVPRIVEGHKTGIDVEVRIPFYYVCVPPWNEEVPYIQYSYLFVKSFLHNQMQNFLI